MPPQPQEQAKGTANTPVATSSKRAPANAATPQGATKKGGKKEMAKRPPLPVECDTPMPLLDDFTAPTPSTAVRTGDNDVRLAQQYRRQAELFREHADVYRAPFQLEELRSSRVKNAEPERLKAQETMDSLADQAPQILSCIVVDQDGEILVAYMSKRVVKPLGPKALDDSAEAVRRRLLGRAKPLSKQFEGRTAEDIPQDVKYTYDGVEKNIVQRTYEATQYLAAFHRPAPDPRDIRHRPPDSTHDPRVIEYPTIHQDPPDLSAMGTRLKTLALGRAEQKRKREAKLLETRNVEGPEKYAPGIGLEADKTYYCPIGRTWERAGVMHLVHCWHQQGTAAGDIIAPSKDMIGNSGRATQVNAVYFTITGELAIIVAACFKVLFPKYYDQYKEDFDRGVWDRTDPGPFLGRAVVFKLQVYVHQDGLDRGPTVSIPAGYYVGGAMHFPDLRAVYGHGPGDICFSMSADLYHAIDAWEPSPIPPEVAAQHITPGRISTVFFCPEKTARTLEGKPKNWNRDTAGGITAHPSLPRHSTSSTQPSTSDDAYNEEEDVQASPSSTLSPAALAAKAKKKKRRTRMRVQRDSKNGET